MSQEESREQYSDGSWESAGGPPNNVHETEHLVFVRECNSEGVEPESEKDQEAVGERDQGDGFYG